MNKSNSDETLPKRKAKRNTVTEATNFSNNITEETYSIAPNKINKTQLPDKCQREKERIVITLRKHESCEDAYVLANKVVTSTNESGSTHNRRSTRRTSLGFCSETSMETAMALKQKSNSFSEELHKNTTRKSNNKIQPKHASGLRNAQKYIVTMNRDKTSVDSDEFRNITPVKKVKSLNGSIQIEFMPDNKSSSDNESHDTPNVDAIIKEPPRKKKSKYYRGVSYSFKNGSAKSRIKSRKSILKKRPSSISFQSDTITSDLARCGVNNNSNPINVSKTTDASGLAICSLNKEITSNTSQINDQPDLYGRSSVIENSLNNSQATVLPQPADENQSNASESFNHSDLTCSSLNDTNVSNSQQHICPPQSAVCDTNNGNASNITQSMSPSKQSNCDSSEVNKSCALQIPDNYKLPECDLNDENGSENKLEWADLRGATCKDSPSNCSENIVWLRTGVEDCFHDENDAIDGNNPNHENYSNYEAIDGNDASRDNYSNYDESDPENDSLSFISDGEPSNTSQSTQNYEGESEKPALSPVNSHEPSYEAMFCKFTTSNHELTCLCNIREKVFTKVAENDTKIYCEAIDTVYGRNIGCCNLVRTHENLKVSMHRAHTHLSFMRLCNLHIRRMRAHNCCISCGYFCTQGQFRLCEKSHLFHDGCEKETIGVKLCPHCGSSSTKKITMLMAKPENVVYLPSRKLAASDTNMIGQKCEYTLKLLTGYSLAALGLPDDTKKRELDAVILKIESDDSGISSKYTLENYCDAVNKGNSEIVMRCLIGGIDVNHVSEDWRMGAALHIASEKGYYIIACVLVEAGAIVNLLDEELNSPLMLAIVNKHNDIVQLLLNSDADIYVKDKEGKSVLHHAAIAGNVQGCHSLLSSTNRPNKFLNSVDAGGWTALSWASEYGHADVVRYLLSNNADPFICDNECNHALHWAAYSGNVEIVRMLLDAGSDVNAANIYGDTPLHISTRRDKCECVQLLLSAGARVDLKNNFGVKPIDLCQSDTNKCYPIIELTMQFKEMQSHNRRKTVRIMHHDISVRREVNPIRCKNSVDDEPLPEFEYYTECVFASDKIRNLIDDDLIFCGCQGKCGTDVCPCNLMNIECWYDHQGKLKDHYNYDDPLIIFECNILCGCDSRSCYNRVVQNGTAVRLSVIRTNNKGWGVTALQTIQKGTFVCEYIGEIVSSKTAKSRKDTSYLFDLDNPVGQHYYLDAKRLGNVARFVNHSCSPNMLPIKVFVDIQDLRFPRIAYFAKQDISAGEELTVDYGDNFKKAKNEKFHCHCETEDCRFKSNSQK